MSARLRRRRRPRLPGQRAAPGGRRRRWRFLPPWRVARWILLPPLVLAVLTVTVAAGAVFVFWPTDLPPAKALEEYTPSLGSRVYASDDEFLTEFQAEKRIFVPLQQIPPALRNAIIAVEDARFYSHFGVDVRGILRAAYQNFRHGRVVEGGSTITQQLAKVLFLTPDRSFSRKVKEALLALELEKRYSKDRLLELYLNQVYMGHGAYGVEAAARMYFGKSVQDLMLPEAAMLAALPRSPGNYSPFERPELAQRRRSIVVSRLLEHGYIGEAEAKAANRAALGLIPPERRRGSGQYFLEYLQQSLEAKYGGDVLYKSGLAIYTTLDPVLQRVAEQALRDGLQALTGRQAAAAGRRQGSPPPVAPEGAVVVMEAATGYIKALIGGADFARTEFNRALHAHRQPGSAFKPFVYLAALEAGHVPTEVLDDSPIRYVS
ncbi:MAG TPA: transglycosylase domain-containing protein, partial [Solirubrobacterales bacterium]|nr:transglycosylase domain-containing protein [Solirubrobacterales bacterium]